MPDVRPGPWLRLIAVGASAAAALAVVSGALSLHTAHRALAALAVPALAALVAAAWVAHRRLLGPSVSALSLFVAAALVVGRPLHIAFAALALAAALVATAATLRGEPVPAASLRDYVTLTKPRIMSLLLITGASGMIVGARGFPSAWLFAVAMTGLALACGGASALNHVLDRDIDRHMRRTDRRPVAADRVVPTRVVRTTLIRKTRVPKAITNAPIVETRFHAAHQPWWLYVHTRRGIPSNPRKCCGKKVRLMPMK